MAQELGQSQLPSTSPVLFQNFPLSTMVYFQFVFAAITIIIMAGSFLCRMSFTAWMIFVPLWITFSYTIGAYSL
jgi:Amt family ammonium transporter